MYKTIAEPYGINLYICSKDDSAELLKLCPDFPVEMLEYKGCCGWEVIDNESSAIIVLSDSCAVSTLVHECVHAKNFIFNYVQVEVIDNKDEHEAYFVDYLVRLCMQSGIIKELRHV